MNLDNNKSGHTVFGRMLNVSKREMASASGFSVVFLTVLILGMLAHGYVFFDAAFTHDSLNALYADSVENAWKISLGRIVKPIYQTLIRGEFAIPWLIGCLSLFWGGYFVLYNYSHV